MADTKISELPVANAIASPDVAPIVQGGVTKQANVSLFGSSFLSANVARVDPSGNDTSGTVGDLNKPFLTVQGAINAIEAGGVKPLLQVIDIGANDYSIEDVTTSYGALCFVAIDESNKPFGSLTCTGTNYLEFVRCTATGAITADSPDGLFFDLHDTFLGDITNSTGFLDIQGTAGARAVVQGTVSCPGFPINMRNIETCNRIDSDASDVTLGNTIITSFEVANSVTLTDSRLVSNSSGVIPTYTDILLNPALMDFSTLPTSIPTRVGAAWIDTTGGLNIIKVKL